ncbi:lys-63-specific deubiquitinase BRCC36 isoform X1 [Strigops habroptila]|uniref:lys-63-specific deubiquitinase BRCC36 isoform X1 n=1 Tax=Strigops habroptila TaxID=2489341 RepID=UPI0011CF32B1|nr:lys-63-specific deubiquitinase BRCC36 isoform X1 [Strigops habroptila]
MAVQAVYLEADAFLVCLNHALSTEKEEVMGLCIGEVDTSRIVHIHSVIILRRSDKRKDRVEISPEQLSAASTEAERLAEMTGRPMRVVGWYHSHPHITVWPSHVDVRTQAMYQMMDQGFVGLIFSCFIEDKNTKTGRILYTCFQSIQAQKSSEYERIEIPIHVVPHETIGKVCLESAVELPKILCQEEQDAYRRIHSVHKEPLQPDVSHQWASPSVAGGQTRAEQTAGAGAAAGEGAAPGGTRCLRMKEETQTLQKRDMRETLQDLLLAEGWPDIALQ